MFNGIIVSQAVEIAAVKTFSPSTVSAVDADSVAAGALYSSEEPPHAARLRTIAPAKSMAISFVNLFFMISSTFFIFNIIQLLFSKLIRVSLKITDVSVINLNFYFWIQRITYTVTKEVNTKYCYKKRKSWWNPYPETL